MERFAYDEAGRIVSKTYRSGKKEKYGYDIFGNPLIIKTEKKYTPEDTEENRRGCGEDEKYTYEYDKDGRIKNASGGGIKYTYEYDICGRLKSKSACGRTLIKYGYDLNGNKISVTDVTGKTTLYKYDITDRLTIISENDKILAEYTYTSCGKVSEIKCGDIKTEYRYDPDGRKAVLKVTVGANIISDIKYSYDESGNCIKKVNCADGINAVTDYVYDGMGRLIKVNSPNTDETYTYDNAGNRISRTINGETEEKYSYNELNELLSIKLSTKDGSEKEVRNFTYDAGGNMTSDGRGIYKYDGLNRMSEAVMEDGRKLTCRYDAEGLRHETEENGRLVRFIYSGREAVCEEADDNITRYIRGNGRLIALDSENARTYYHYACDSLGSITHVVAGNEFGNDETNGNVNSRILCSYEYDAFGKTINEEETVTNRYGFTGKIHDDITDMYYLRARYYAPYTGRFTQADTYHGDGLNLYVYAGNNPVKYVDHNGHDKHNSGSTLFDTFGVQPGINVDLKNPSALNNRSYITYVFKNQSDEIVYVGRASGNGNPVQVMKGRISKGHDHFKPGYKYEIVATQTNKLANQGAEEFFILGYEEMGIQLENIDPSLSYRSDRVGKTMNKIEAFFEDLFK